MNNRNEDEIVFSRESFNIYMPEIETARQDRSIMLPSQKESSFKKIKDAVRKEYREGKYPVLTVRLLTAALVNPKSIEYWDVYLYRNMIQPELDLKKGIIDNAGMVLTDDDRERHIKQLKEDIIQLHNLYFSKEGKELLELRKQKQELENAIQSKKEEIAQFEQTEKERIREELRQEKEKLLSELKENQEYLFRFQEAEKHNREIKEMVEDRRSMEKHLADEMNRTSRSFRDRTEEVVTTIQDILKSSLLEIAENTRKEIDQLETHTENAINSVADINRKLQNDDFKTLLQGYQRLEEQLYYKSRSGTDTPEYKTYWRNVQVYLKGFEKTLNKLGYSRIYPKVGSVLDVETMEVFEEGVQEDTDLPEESEFEEYTVAAVVSSGFYDSASFVEEKAKVIPRKKNMLQQEGSDLS